MTFRLANDKRSNTLTSQKIITNTLYATDIFGNIKGNTSGLIFNSSTIIFNSNDFCINSSNQIKLNASETIINSSNINLNGSLIINNNDYGYFTDNKFKIVNNTDNTKQAIFNTATISTGTIRGYSLPDTTGIILLNNDATVNDTALIIGQSTRRFRFDTSSIGLGTTRVITVRNQSGTLALTSDLGVYSDSTFRIFNNAVSTKQIAFNASAITIGTTRTYTMPNESGPLAIVERGIYNPTTVSSTGMTNIASHSSYYQRIEKMIHVYGGFTFDTTGSTTVLLSFAPPTGYPISGSSVVYGVCAYNNTTTGSNGGVAVKSASNIQLRFISGATATGYIASYSYSYFID